ncbi:MAG: DHHA1 domain-containing protein, partial [Acidobacteria bacterium]|nr:DHHA1 domain-containing protein [Acidobacteriota bacterium]
DYDRANRTARAVAAMFSVGRDEAAGSVARLMEEHKQLARRLRSLEEVAARAEAEGLLGGAKALAGGVRLCALVFEDRDAESLKKLAQSLIARPKTIALLGSREGGDARLVFARSADAHGDMNAILREACATLDGRGGGRPDMAQGGGSRVEKLAEAVEAAARRLEDSGG